MSAKVNAVWAIQTSDVWIALLPLQAAPGHVAVHKCGQPDKDPADR